MSKPYTEAHFSAQITEDRNWRLKEISDLKVATRRADERLQRVLLRSLITICYAHWEGYVRFSAKKYLEYVALRKFQYDELDRQFLKNYFLPRLASLSRSQTTISERCTLIDEIMDSRRRRFTSVNEHLVNTRANLSFDTFRDICLICGVSSDFFSQKSEFIDLMLLRRRNAVAHGEDTLVGIQDLDMIADETTGLMRAFGDELENRVVLQTFRVARDSCYQRG